MEEGLTPIEIVVETEIATEVRDLKVSQSRYDGEAFDLQPQVEAAERRYEQTEDPADQEEWQRLHRRLVTAINRGVAISERLQVLHSAGEIERRVSNRLAQKKRINALRERSNMAKETARDQGVPDEYLNEAGNFRIGMDARLKSDLVNSAVGAITKEKPGNSLHVFTEKQATELLQKRDWMGFLDRKREIIQADGAKKAQREKEREERERERAEEKAKKDAEKKAEKERKAAEKAASANTSGSDEGKAESASAAARRQREEKAAAAAS